MTNKKITLPRCQDCKYSTTDKSGKWDMAQCNHPESKLDTIPDYHLGYEKYEGREIYGPYMALASCAGTQGNCK